MSALPEILDYCETPIGVLCLRRRELLASPGTMVTEVTLDHEFLMSSFHTESERALADRTLDWHGGGADLRVLVGGLGLGYTARAALDGAGVVEVEVLELLPEVIRWLERGLVPLAGELLADSRFKITRGDFFAVLAGEPSRTRDAILIDVDHSPDELLDDARSASFYSRDGLARAREHLAPGGVLAVWSSGESASFEDALAAVFAEVKVERIDWVNELIDREQTDWIFLARG